MYRIEFDNGHPSAVTCDSIEELHAVMSNGFGGASTSDKPGVQNGASMTANAKRYLQANPDAKPLQVVAALAAEGVNVTPSIVSAAKQSLRLSSGKPKTKRGGRTAKAK